MENPDIIIIPADFPKERITDWRVLLQVRAMQNKCYIIGVNTPNGGNSMVIDPKGNIIKELGFGKGCMVFKIP
jgi:predicted amidohydrolase